QTFTHEPLPAESGELEREANRFLEGIEPLIRSERLSAILLQFPFSFRWDPSSLARLQHIERSFGHLPLVLEVRHRSWFGSEALQAIEALDLSLAAIDLPYAADHPPPIPWGPSGPPNLGPVGYLRLHGRNADAWFDPRAGRDQRYDYLYGPDEVAEIVKATRRLASGRDETFVITNNHFSGKAVANALEILSELGGEKRLAPSELVQAFPRLRERTRPDGQQTLF
ncbi:MAG: DUF72 domain-containing protein, partial [Planctomycetota bacterium]|nr:DUF72 domain-containing protein [Planctomycetota bacterium]